MRVNDFIHETSPKNSQAFHIERVVPKLPWGHGVGWVWYDDV